MNHEKHNLDFFYALLVVSRRPGGKAASRYSVKHYFLLRGDDAVYEIDPALVVTTEEAPIWPLGLRSGATNAGLEGRQEVRAKDSAIIPELFPSLRPYWSKRANTLYWKGVLELVNGSSVNVTVPETSPSESGEASRYQVLVKKVPSECTRVYEEFRGREFNSAAQAVSAFERHMNRSLYRAINEQGYE